MYVLPNIKHKEYSQYMLDVSSIVLNTCISSLDYDLCDTCKSFRHDNADGIFNVKFSAAELIFRLFRCTLFKKSEEQDYHSPLELILSL
jgi:hypothetical protein